MLLILSVFLLRYAANVGMAFNPGWRTAPELLLPLALLYGGFSGLFLGRSLSLLKLARAGATGPARSRLGWSAGRGQPLSQ